MIAHTTILKIIIGSIMRDTQQCVALIGYGILIGLGAMLIWPFAPFRHTTKDWVDVLSAVGTCGAVVVALGFGITQEVIRRNDSLAKAKIVGAYLTPRLAVVMDAAVKTREALFGDADGVTKGMRCQTAAELCRPMDWTIPPNDLAALTPLPRAAAFRLARAMALINTVAADIALKARVARPFAVSGRRLESVFETWELQLNDGMQLLEKSLTELLAVSAELTGKDKYLDAGAPDATP
ncbi:hypothetical protein [Paraburkholderia aromaticivorans]|uniref:hypothetical protein n=1 Tax=Paraburkholderia aromaticivorans TaxID=2026199 RepID=UPI001455E903|nr:hypothetical protein [Paraburkholderia aromaticivorans]